MIDSILSCIFTIYIYILVYIYIYHIPSANLNHPETLKIIPMTGRFWDRNIQARPKNSNHPIIYWHNSLSSWPESMHARSKPDKWDKGWEGTGKKKQCFLLHPWKLTCNLQINQLWTFICKHMLWIWTILQNEPIIILISFCLAKLTRVVFLTLFTTFCNMFNMLYIRICRLIFSLCSFSRFPSCQKSPFCILHLESNTFSPQDIQYIRTLPSWVHGRSNVLMNFIGTSVNLRVWQDKAWRFFLTLESCYLPWDLEKKDKQIPANYTRMTRRTSAKQNSRFD